MRYWQVLLMTLLLGTLLGCGATAQRQQQAKSHYTLGISHLQGGSPTLALKEFLQAAELDPQDAATRAALAQAYQLKKAYVDAERHYRHALQLSDNDPRYQNNLAALYLDMGRWDQALEYFKKASDNLLFLRSEVALTGMGYALFRKGDYPAAISAFREAEAIAPGYPPVYLRLGEVFYALDRIEAAEESFRRALEIAPEYMLAHYHLGLVHLKQKQLAKAAEQFRKVKQLAPDSEWGQKAANILKTLP